MASTVAGPRLLFCKMLHCWPLMPLPLLFGEGGGEAPGEGAEGEEEAGEAPRPATMPEVEARPGGCWRLQPEAAFRKQQLGQLDAELFSSNVLRSGGSKVPSVQRM